jgi:hypothetical protein
MLLLLVITALYQLRMFVSEDWIRMLKEAVRVDLYTGAYRKTARMSLYIYFIYNIYNIK